MCLVLHTTRRHVCTPTKDRHKMSRSTDRMVLIKKKSRDRMESLTTGSFITYKIKSGYHILSFIKLDYYITSFQTFVSK